MPAPPRRKLLIIGWDSADWNLLTPLMESGRMPALSRLVEQGCMGQISTLHPVYSPMLWTSIATGKRPYKHGVLGFSEPLPDRSGVRPVSSLSRRTRAFWNIFHLQGWRGHVVGWWPSHPAEPINGCMISNLCHHATGPEEDQWPLPPGGIHPAAWRETLADLRVHPNDFTPAHVEPFIPLAREIEQKNDLRLAVFQKTLAEACTVHSWALHLAENTEWDYLAVYYDALDHFGHGFMKYHPPRRDAISERDFELYSGVVTQAACFHDMMLGALLSKVPADTTVMLLSDHGFHSDESRPINLAPIPAGRAAEHSDFGIFVVRGPGIRRDHLLNGVSVLDVTPTLLALQGLPVGEDMDGRAALDAFETPPQVGAIPSWDAVDGEDGSHRADLRPDPESERAALEQLIALGYVERPPADMQQAVRNTERELEINLAEALIDGNREIDALPILRKLCAETPEEWRFHLRLAMACRNLGRIGELREVVERLQSQRAECEASREKLREWEAEVRRRAEQRRVGGTPADQPLLSPEEHADYTRAARFARLNTHGLDFLRAVVALAENRGSEALALLRAAEKGLSDIPGLYLQIGETYQQLRRWTEAGGAFQRALQLDPRNPHAHVGLARCHVARRRWKEAADSARAAICAWYDYPLAHFLLGVALVRGGTGNADEALSTWEQTLRLNPGFWPAHLRLARMKQSSEPEKAAWHRHQAQQARRRAMTVAAERASEAQPEIAAVALTGGELEGDFSFEILGLAQPSFGHDAVTVVTGLPRSGTSMLMQMLRAGGVAPLDDGRREADDDNPLGYFELEAVKSLQADSSWVGDAAGKSIKVVLPHLPHLPAGLHYHVLLIERDLDEVLRSQQAMLARKGEPGQVPKVLRPAYERLLRTGRELLAARPQIRALRLKHRWVIENPSLAAQAIADFLAVGLDVDRMAAAVDPGLHRQRA